MAEKPRVRPVVRKEALLIFRTLSGVPGLSSVWKMKQEPWLSHLGRSSNPAQERLPL